MVISPEHFLNELLKISMLVVRDGFAADRRVPVHLAVDELQCSKAYWKKFERLVTTSRR